MPASLQPSGKTYHAVTLLAIGLITLIVYAGSLRNGFIWDDALVIEKNDFARDLGNIRRLFDTSYLTRVSVLKSLGGRDIGSGEASYRPVVTLSYFIDYHFWKLKPFGYHLTSLLVHICNGILLYYFFSLICGNAKTALLGALLFLLHPVHSETVSVISLREDLLAFFFSLAAFIAFIKADTGAVEKRGTFYLLSVVSLFFGLFSKESALIVPGLFLLYHFVVRRQTEQRCASDFWLRFAGYLLVTVIYMLIRFKFMNNYEGVDEESAMADPITRIATMIRVLGIYIAWLALPFDVHPTLPGDIWLLTRSLLDLRVIYSAILAALVLVLGLKIRKRRPLYAFAICWFFIALVPVTNILFPLTNYMASRYLYLPAAGFCLLAAMLLCDLCVPDPLTRRYFISKNMARVVVTAVMVLYSLFTMSLNIIWKNNLMFWQNMETWYPRNSLAQHSLGSAFLEAGDLAAAGRSYQAALTLAPGNAATHVDLGTCYWKKGMPDKAQKHYRQALALDLRALDAYINLGIILGQKGSFLESVEVFKSALAIDPSDARLYSNLGTTYALMGRYVEAEGTWRRGLEIKPDDTEMLTGLKTLKEIQSR